MKSLYTKLGLQYQQAYSGPYRDLTVTGENYRLVASSKGGQLTGFGRPIMCLGDIQSALRAFKRLYEKYPDIWYWSYDVLDPIGKYLVGQGYVPGLKYTQVIDLTLPLPVLHADMRKSYQNLANRYQPVVSFYKGDINTFKQLHIDVCGYQTRSDETWEIQKRMMEANQAFIVHSPSWDAAGLFLYDKTHCYYGVGKSLEGAASHPILWKAICQAKHLGCTEFEMGEQVFDGDTKAVGISTFKRGFGGQTRIRLEFKGAK